jgi:2',3'-cyclic-nucleotide 2'-phosphodiesterase/3'-nucleotidase
MTASICPGVSEVASVTGRRTIGRSTPTTVGTATAAFDPAGARYHDNPVLTLMHRAQREAAGTELSSATLFHPDRGLAAGPVRILDLFRIYPFENSLTVLELTVDDVRAYLEEIALAYAGPAVGGEPPPLDERVKPYNHDSVAGAEYVIDPGRPAGHRVTRLTFGGEEWPGARTVSLALSSYRAAGGGGYRTLRRGRIARRTERSVREELIAYVRRRGTIAPETEGNWSVVGA